MEKKIERESSEKVERESQETNWCKKVVSESILSSEKNYRERENIIKKWREKMKRESTM